MDSDAVARNRSAVLALLVLLSGRVAAAVLLCHYCPLQAAGTRCNITTECHGHERCSTGWRRYGLVHVLALQGCVSPEVCGSNRTLTHKGLKYEITYTCCCHDLCNTATAPENPLHHLLRVTVSPADPPSCLEL